MPSTASPQGWPELAGSTHPSKGGAVVVVVAGVVVVVVVTGEEVVVRSFALVVDDADSGGLLEHAAAATTAMHAATIRTRPTASRCISKRYEGPVRFAGMRCSATRPEAGHEA